MAKYVNPVCLKGTPFKVYPKKLLFHFKWNIDTVNGYIFMAQETSDHVWVSKKIFLWISIKSYWASKKYLWSYNSTLVKHRAPCIAHRDGRPRQSDATGLESVFVHYKALLGTQIPKGLTTYLGPRAHPNPPTLGLKAMWGVNALSEPGGHSRDFGSRT